MSILTSKELFINIKNKPVWNPNKHFYEQDLDTLQFYEEEKRKINEGVNIGGYYVHPWLYWHINFFKTPIPVPNSRGIVEDITMCPPLDDNILYVTESYQQAEKENKGLTLFGSRGFSKALRDDEPLLYEDKTWRPIGKAKEGDRIFGADGKVTTIKGVYPQGEVDIYKLKLRDGREIHCCDEHLWYVYDAQARKYKTLPLKEIIKNYKYNRKYTGNKYKNGKDRVAEVYNYYLPTNKCMEFEEEHLPIDPYFLGVWLGDGSATATAVSSADQEIVDCVYKIANKYGLSVRKNGKYDHVITSGKRQKNPLKNKLRNLNVLGNKHIPDIYLKGSEKQRLELLKGLLDTDGTIEKTGNNISFCQANYDFILQVRELCFSLGISCTIHDTSSSYIKKDGEKAKAWKLSLYTNKDLFKIKRKSSRISKRNNKGKKFREGHSAIVDIQKTKPAKATCIRVDNEDKLFVTKDFIVSHNTSILTSLTQWSTTTKENGTISITGGSDKDLKAISKLLKVAFNNVDRAFYMPTLQADWDSEVNMGFKEKNNFQHLYSTLSITNANKGTKKESEKGAGLSPVGYIIDEIGKFSFLDILESAEASFRTQYGWKLVPVLSGTSGNEVLSKDAKKLLSNPEQYGMLLMNWDRLDRRVPEEAITWERSKKQKFCTFVPAQMSYRLESPKKETNLAEYLGESSKDLKKIKVMETDWVGANRRLDEIDSTKKTEDAKNRQKMYYPRETADCFLTKQENPFPTHIIDRHIRKLEDEGNIGRDVEIFKFENKIRSEFVNKKRAEVSHPGGVADAPIISFEIVPEVKPPRGIHAAGFDGYKLDVSETDSLGSLYVLKRRNIIGENTPCETIACSYTARPDKMREFNQRCERILETWNAECLMESVDVAFKHHLENKNKDFLYLAPALTFADNSNLTQRYGLYPSKGNNEYRMNLLIAWCKEEHHMGDDEEGNPIIKTGVEFIEDIDLLKEMMNYEKGGNFDRITAFSHALVQCERMDKDNVLPDRRIKREVTTTKPKPSQMRSKYGRRLTSKYRSNTRGKKY